MLKRLLVVTLLAAMALPTLADDTAKPAEAVMNAAFARAKAEHKAVVLSFHASWCGWCHKLENFLNRKDIKPIWDKRVVMVWLTVLESPSKKSDENPGGDEWLKKYGGEDEGIPYLVVFNGDGKALGDSRMDGKAHGNTGYPAKPEEIAWFIGMLKKGVPNMTAGERAKIQKALEEEAKKLG